MANRYFIYTDGTLRTLHNNAGWIPITLIDLKNILFVEKVFIKKEIPNFNFKNPKNR